jgi:hypothetical protein
MQYLQNVMLLLVKFVNCTDNVTKIFSLLALYLNDLISWMWIANCIILSIIYLNFGNTGIGKFWHCSLCKNLLIYNHTLSLIRHFN